MKRTVLTVALCVGVLWAGLATSASATDPFKALDRQVNRLETRLDRVQGQLLGFEDAPRRASESPCIEAAGSLRGVTGEPPDWTREPEVPLGFDGRGATRSSSARGF
jgi:hypothetical protein